MTEIYQLPPCLLTFLKEANYSMECRVVKGENHSLTGGKEEFRAMAGEHFQCYMYCADSLIFSMSELLTANSMK